MSQGDYITTMNFMGSRSAYYDTPRPCRRAPIPHFNVATRAGETDERIFTTSRRHRAKVSAWLALSGETRQGYRVSLRRRFGFTRTTADSRIVSCLYKESSHVTDIMSRPSKRRRVSHEAGPPGADGYAPS